MSSAGSPPLDLDVRARRWEQRLAILSLLIGAAGPWFIGLPVWAAAPLMTVIIISLACGFSRAGWIGRGRLQRVIWLADGRWLLVDGLGNTGDGMLRADSRVGAGFVWLRWKAERNRSMLLLAGELGASDLRRLSVRLRLEGARGTDMSGAAPREEFVT